MPLELGIFLGAKRFGEATQKKKNCLILDAEPYRYQIFISDIAGQDIRAHGKEPAQLIINIRNWLNTASRHKNIPGGNSIVGRYEEFSKALPNLCRGLGLDIRNIPFADYHKTASVWLDERLRAA